MEEDIVTELLILNEKVQAIMDVLSSWALSIASIQYWLTIILPAVAMFALLWWVIRQFLWTR